VASFVLKYRDDESDYVTLENQADLTTALMISPTLLRIAVEKTNVPVTCHTSTQQENRKRPHHDHQHHNRRDCHDRRDHHHHKKASSYESHRDRVEKKLVFL
jgi:hypothetical protein